MFQDPISILMYQGCQFITERVVVHPNMITTLRLLIMIGLTIGVYHYKYPVVMAMLFQVCWFLDHLDGEMARQHKLITEFGDTYDHIVDMVYAVPLLTIIIMRLYNKTGFVILMMMGGILTYTGFALNACQEQELHDNKSQYASNYLKSYNSFCPRNQRIKSGLRYFGLSVFMLYISMLIIYTS